MKEIIFKLMKNNNKNELNNNLPKKYFNIIKKEKCEGFDNNIFFI